MNTTTLSTQVCSRCGEAKTQEHYHPGKWGTNGTYCRDCYKTYKREQRIKTGITTKHGPELPPPLIDRPRLPNYNTLHYHIRVARGKATEYVCPCGSQATEWAYNHTDPNPVRGYSSRGIAVEYSLDFSRYVAMCKPCHQRFDIGR
jgi:hypothetical protein